MEYTQTDLEVKIDELITTRNNLVSNIKRIEGKLLQAFEIKKDFPYRWYVTYKYIERKEFKPISDYFKSKKMFSGNYFDGNGYGMIDGESLFIPEDCNYDDSREITLKEALFILSQIQSKEN